MQNSSINTEISKTEKLRKEAWNNSLYCFGKGYIFDKRAEKYSKLVNLLKVFGIIVPVAVGATATGYGFDSEVLKLMIAIAIPATILQLIISLFAIVFKWDEELAYSYEASQDYNSLSTSFKRIAEFPENGFENFRAKFEKLEVHFEQRSKQDAKHSIKEWELRKAMRFSLRQFQRECVGCNETPTSMESTECNICGKFESQLKKHLKKWTKKLYMS